VKARVSVHAASDPSAIVTYGTGSFCRGPIEARRAVLRDIARARS